MPQICHEHHQNIKTLYQDFFLQFIAQHFKCCKVKEFHKLQTTVVPVMNGYPRDQAKVSVHCRWPLIRGNLTLKCVGRGIDNVAVQGRWPLTTGVAQGRYYCTANFKMAQIAILFLLLSSFFLLLSYFCPSFQ